VAKGAVAVVGPETREAVPQISGPWLVTADPARLVPYRRPGLRSSRARADPGRSPPAPRKFDGALCCRDLDARAIPRASSAPRYRFREQVYAGGNTTPEASDLLQHSTGHAGRRRGGGRNGGFLSDLAMGRVVAPSFVRVCTTDRDHLDYHETSTTTCGHAEEFDLLKPVR